MLAFEFVGGQESDAQPSVAKGLKANQRVVPASGSKTLKARIRELEEGAAFRREKAWFTGTSPSFPPPKPCSPSFELGWATQGALTTAIAQPSNQRKTCPVFLVEPNALDCEVSVQRNQRPISAKKLVRGIKGYFDCVRAEDADCCGGERGQQSSL